MCVSFVLPAAVIFILFFFFPSSTVTHHFLGQLISQELILDAFLLHLLALLVIVDGQLLQSLQHFLHLSFGTVTLHLQPAEFSLDLVPISPGRGQQLQAGGGDC